MISLSPRCKRVSFRWCSGLCDWLHWPATLPRQELHRLAPGLSKAKVNSTSKCPSSLVPPHKQNLKTSPPATFWEYHLQRQVNSLSSSIFVFTYQISFKMAPKVIVVGGGCKLPICFPSRVVTDHQQYPAWVLPIPSISLAGMFLYWTSKVRNHISRTKSICAVCLSVEPL